MHLILRKMNSTLLPRYKISQILFAILQNLRNFIQRNYILLSFYKVLEKKLAFTIVFIKLIEVNLHMTEKTWWSIEADKPLYIRHAQYNTDMQTTFEERKFKTMLNVWYRYDNKHSILILLRLELFFMYI